MKTCFKLAVLALVLTLMAPRESFALWDVLTLTPEEAARLGIEVRATGNPESVSVAVEFALADALKDFEGAYLEIKPEGDSVISVPMREERTDAEHVILSFFSHRDQLDTLAVRIRVPGGLGGTLYVIPVDDFVD